MLTLWFLSWEISGQTFCSFCRCWHWQNPQSWAFLTSSKLWMSSEVADDEISKNLRGDLQCALLLWPVYSVLRINMEALLTSESLQYWYHSVFTSGVSWTPRCCVEVSWETTWQTLNLFYVQLLCLLTPVRLLYYVHSWQKNWVWSCQCSGAGAYQPLGSWGFVCFFWFFKLHEISWKQLDAVWTLGEVNASSEHWGKGHTQNIEHGHAVQTGVAGQA